MKTYKDIVISLVIVVWLALTFTLWHYMGDVGITLGHIGLILTMVILLLFKEFSRFGIWLETEIKRKNE